MVLANLLLSISTCLLGLIYKNSLEYKMAFSKRTTDLLTANKLGQYALYTEEAFNILCLMIVLVPLGLLYKGFRFTHFLAGLALLVLNFAVNFDIANPTEKYFLMLACLSVGLVASGCR